MLIYFLIVVYRTLNVTISLHFIILQNLSNLCEINDFIYLIRNTYEEKEKIKW